MKARALLLLILLAGCLPPTGTPIPPTGTRPPANPASPTAAPTPLPTGTPVPPAPSASPSPSPTPSPPPTVTPAPAYIILRGRVIPAHVNCRYGPGFGYLYKYGLVGGSNLEIIGRNWDGSWLLLRAIGGNNPCWAKASLLEPAGDVLHVEPVDPHVILPWSPYYTPLTNVTATREGDVITVSWSPLPLRAGDEHADAPYIIEAWVCREGQLVFVALAVYYPEVGFVDEAGCAEPSHGVVLAAEKHGYTLPVAIPWPPPEG